MRFPRDEVESAVVLSTLSITQPRSVSCADRLLDSNPLDLLVAHHVGAMPGGCALGVRQRQAEPRCSMSPMARWLHRQFGAPPFEAVVQFVEVRLRLGDVAFEAGDVLAPRCGGSPARRATCWRDGSARRGDLKVPCDGLHLAAHAGAAISLEERIERLLDESLLHAARSGMAAVARDRRADRERRPARPGRWADGSVSAPDSSAGR